MIPLWKHQEMAINLAKDKKNFALFHDMGTGKTRTMLEILRYHYNNEKQVLNTLIISPLITLHNWENEIKTYTKIPHNLVTVLEGSSKEKNLKLLDAKGIVIVNYDFFSLRANNRQSVLNAIKVFSPKILILDESHKIKNISSLRTKTILKLAEMQSNGYRFIMTGSPVTNNQMDLYSQFLFLDKGETFGNNFTAFRSTYFHNVSNKRPGDRGYFPIWIPKKGVEEKMFQKISKKSHVVKKQECLDLPPLVRKKIEVGLNDKQQKLYADIKQDYITYINDKAAVASIALTKLLRLQQVCSGFLKMEDGSIEVFDSPKISALKELLEDHSPFSKIIVWAVFHEDYKTIEKVCQDLKIEYRLATGLQKDSEKQKNLEDFRKDTKVRVLIGSPAAIGIGINLVESDLSIWYSRSFNLEYDEQANARNYRGGSERHQKVTRVDLICRKTVDNLIYESILDKKILADKILGIDPNLI